MEGDVTPKMGILKGSNRDCEFSSVKDVEPDCLETFGSQIDSNDGSAENKDGDHKSCSVIAFSKERLWSCVLEIPKAMAYTDKNAPVVSAPTAEDAAVPKAEEKAAKATKAKAPKEKKPKAPKDSKSTPAHPSYTEMITEATSSPKERLQSSVLEVVVKDKSFIKDDIIGRINVDLTEVPTRVSPASPLAPQWYRLEDYLKMDFELEHRHVDRAETEGEIRLKEEIIALKAQLKETGSEQHLPHSYAHDSLPRVESIQSVPPCSTTAAAWEGLLQKKSQRARQLMAQHISEYHEKSEKSSDMRMVSMAQKSGTTADRLAAVTVLVQDNPLANLKALQRLTEEK